MVTKTTTPSQSHLYARYEEGDFLDCYTVASNKDPRTAADILLTMPWWARALMVMRNLLVAPFGLTTETNDQIDKIGLFPVDTETDSEITAGFDDKHLEFRISVLREDGMIYLSTWVQPHNVWGRLYLGLVMPFHILIIRNALHRLRKT